MNDWKVTLVDQSEFHENIGPQSVGLDVEGNSVVGVRVMLKKNIASLVI
jgi:hypothetical protein